MIHAELVISIVLQSQKAISKYYKILITDVSFVLILYVEGNYFQSFTIFFLIFYGKNI